MATKTESLEWDGGKQLVIGGEVDTVGLKGFCSEGKTLY